MKPGTHPEGLDGSVAPDGTVISVSRRHEELTKVHELRAVRAACDKILGPLVHRWPSSCAAVSCLLCANCQGWQTVHMDTFVPGLVCTCSSKGHIRLCVWSTQQDAYGVDLAAHAVGAEATAQAAAKAAAAKEDADGILSAFTAALKAMVRTLRELTCRRFC